MTLAAANPGGWSLHEVLTSAQMTFLQNELLKAIDGSGGGTYNLVAPLQFTGSAVRVGANLEVLSTGAVNVQSGGELNLLNGSTGTIDGDLTFAVNSDTLLQSGANLVAAVGALIDIAGGLNLSGTGNLTGTLNVFTGGFIDVGSGGDIHLTNADLAVNSGAAVIVNTSGEIRVGSGGALRVQSDGVLELQPGATATVEDSQDLIINDAPEGFRTTLVPFGFIAAGWVARLGAEFVWEQIDTSAAHRIVFPLAVRPGDDLVDVFVAVNGENGHVGLPATLPVVRLVSVGLDGTTTTLATKTDPSASVGAYEAPHFVVLQTGSLDSGTMPRTATLDPLYVIVTGETGANAIAGLELGSITGNITARSYRSDLGIYS